jgi:hypothetical protein
MSVKHTINTSEGGTETLDMTPLIAIKCFCKECMGYQPSLVEGCTSPRCPLYPFRLGEAHSGKVMSEERREKARARLVEYHSKLKNERSTPSACADKPKAESLSL